MYRIMAAGIEGLKNRVTDDIVIVGADLLNRTWLEIKYRLDVSRAI